MAYNTYKDPIKLARYLQRKSIKRYDKNRLKVITILGGKCATCKLDDPDVLQIDHIIVCGEGRRRPALTQIFPKIIRGEYETANLQVLCANCHMRKTSKERRDATGV